MATQAVVSIVKGGEVVLKLVAGSDGCNAPELAECWRKHPPETPEEALLDALLFEVGCREDRVVLAPDRALHNAEGWETVPPLYRETFADPRFNPRWREGTAAYVEIVEIP